MQKYIDTTLHQRHLHARLPRGISVPVKYKIWFKFVPIIEFDLNQFVSVQDFILCCGVVQWVNIVIDLYISQGLIKVKP